MQFTWRNSGWFLLALADYCRLLKLLLQDIEGALAGQLCAVIINYLHGEIVICWPLLCELVFDIYLAEQDACRYPVRQWLLLAGAAVGIDVRIFAERSSDEIRYEYADVLDLFVQAFDG
ncbi:MULTISPECIES: hypothetical protein [Snodgrassella]|uniref:hypothetical protein n=1 Tax=Snodgrassella TaxID=1193515 RepID=UPI000B8A1FB7|nr:MULTISPECIES: hypothetical protein [Snodgrassella]